MNSMAIAEQLKFVGCCEVKNFLDKGDLLKIRADYAAHFAAGEFTRAKTGSLPEKKINDDIRWDEIHWLDKSKTTISQDILWRKIEALQMALNQTLFLGLNSFDGHYSSYPKGGFYKRHFDSIREKNHRKVSMIVYLNENWQLGDGGQLRIYSENSYTDVSPQGGTMVCFISEEIEHEVLESHVVRESFAGWFSRI